jgi:diguanylate cyclase (GGDEF)-like protein
MPKKGRFPRDATTDRERTHRDQDPAGSDERSEALRVEVARRLVEAGVGLDETASRRDEEARERDGRAAQRDRDALARDVHDHPIGHGLPGEALRSGMAEVRREAAADREEARRDRLRAALDRDLAARDREQAERERRAAGTDELTGARRRGVGLEELDREIDRARRTGTSLVAVFVDVDNLKSVNDEFGHRAGDELLCDVVNGLRGRLRSYDLVIRLGGDEFLCVLPSVSVEGAHARFAGLNAELRKTSTHGSVSVGFSELHAHDSRPDLINRADQELLTARASRVREHR